MTRRKGPTLRTAHQAMTRAEGGLLNTLAATVGASADLAKGLTGGNGPDAAKARRRLAGRLSDVVSDLVERLADVLEERGVELADDQVEHVEGLEGVGTDDTLAEDDQVPEAIAAELADAGIPISAPGEDLDGYDPWTDGGD